MQSISQPLFGLVMQRTLAQMGHRGHCVMRRHNSCKGDNSKHGTDSFHFYLEVFRQ